MILALAACGGGSGGGASGGDGATPTSPSQASGTIGFDLSVGLFQQVPAIATFTLMNETFSTTGGSGRPQTTCTSLAGPYPCWTFLNVSPGVYEVSGTLMSDQVNFRFGRGFAPELRANTYPCPSNPNNRSCGGVDPASLEVLEGPNPELKRSPCVIAFSVNTLGQRLPLPLPQAFRFRLAVRGSIDTSC